MATVFAKPINSILVIGGQQGLLNPLAYIESYDISDSTWGVLPSMPTPRGFASAAIVGCSIFVCGGSNGAGILNVVEKLDLNTYTWSKVPSMLTARQSLATISLSSAIWTIAGLAEKKSVGECRKFLSR